MNLGDAAKIKSRVTSAENLLVSGSHTDIHAFHKLTTVYA